MCHETAQCRGKAVGGVPGNPLNLTSGGLAGDTQMASVERSSTRQVHVDESKVNVHRRHRQSQLQYVEGIAPVRTDQEAETAKQAISPLQMMREEQEYHPLREYRGQRGSPYTHGRKRSHPEYQQRIEYNVENQSDCIEIEGNVTSTGADIDTGEVEDQEHDRYAGSDDSQIANSICCDRVLQPVERDIRVGKEEEEDAKDETY